ncbi:MAG: hypothetical protein H0V67_02730 [Geodermatophilaceae bacterium]|nr:hypothetical protein [Geodermatophilaceae bacterium]
MTGDAAEPSLGSSLRTLGYAHFALMLPVPLAEIAIAREQANLRHASPAMAPAVDPLLLEVAHLEEMIDPAEEDEGVGTSGSDDDTAQVLPEAGGPEEDVPGPEADDTAAVEEALLTADGDESTEDSQRTRNARELLDDIRFLDE